MKRMRALVVVLAMVTCACRERPSDGQLETWRVEAAQANAVAVAKNAEQGPAWTLGVAGWVANPGHTLSWNELDTLATTHVRTRSPQNPANPTAIVDFRGVRVAELLDRAGADASAEEVTFVAYDAFRATAKQKDVRRFPVTLALEADGKPIPRASGGPLFLVFPHTEFPETQSLYPDRYWSFYVTHVVVGTEAIALHVGDQVFDAAALAALPQRSQKGTVAFKVHWPSSEVILQGVRLSEVLKAANLVISPGGGVILRGKAPIQHDAKDPIRLAGADLGECDPLLVTHWGPERTPVSARLGGPLAVAIPAGCAGRYGDKYWVTFLERIEVAP